MTARPAPSWAATTSRSLRHNATSGIDDRVVFASNADYWDGAPDIEYLHLIRYDTAADVYEALTSGELDAVLGARAGVGREVDRRARRVDVEVAVRRRGVRHGASDLWPRPRPAVLLSQHSW